MLRSVAVLDFTNVSGDKRPGVARHGHRRDGDQRSDGLPRPPRRRSRPRRRVVAPHRRIGLRGRAGPGRAAGRRRQLPARGRSPPHHGAHRRRAVGPDDGGCEGGRAARGRVRPAGPDRAAVLGRARRRGRARQHDARRRARDGEPRGVPRGVRGAREAGQPRARATGGRGRGLREGRAPRPAVRDRVRRARQRALPALRGDARAQRARRQPARDGHRPRAPRGGPGRHAGRRPRHARVPAGERGPVRRRTRGGPPRGGARAAATGGTCSGSATRRGAASGSTRCGARWRSTANWRSCTSRSRWCTSRAASSRRPPACCARASSCRTGRPGGRGAIPRRGCTGCSASCCWPRATPSRPSTSSAARSKPASPVRLYGHEFVMNAHDGRGFALLVLHRPDEAAEAFGRALALFPGHARSLIGLAACHAAAGRKSRGPGRTRPGRGVDCRAGPRRAAPRGDRPERDGVGGARAPERRGRAARSPAHRGAAGLPGLDHPHRAAVQAAAGAAGVCGAPGAACRARALTWRSRAAVRRD